MRDQPLEEALPLSRDLGAIGTGKAKMEVKKIFYHSHCVMRNKAIVNRMFLSVLSSSFSQELEKKFYKAKTDLFVYSTLKEGSLLSDGKD